MEKFSMQEAPDTVTATETFEVPAKLDMEMQLTKEIDELWSAHQQSDAILGRTKLELGALRLELGQRLYEMKMILACPGRAGKWSQFLSAQHIPRASADRYVKKYENTLNPPAEIASRESIQQSPGETARKVLQSIWPKLRQALMDQETAYQFLCALVQSFDTLHAEITDSGIAVRKPTAINSEPSSDVLDMKKVVEGQGTGCE
jgi:hypothetical protein